MTASPAAREWKAEVQRNRSVGGGYFTLTLDLPRTFPRPEAGAFVMLSVGHEPDILLRRPMALFDLRRGRSRTEIDILYAVAGRGTSRLASVAAGSRLALLGPIGNGFPKPRRGERVAVLAGGIGIAPFLFWGRGLSPDQRRRTETCFGFRTRAQLAVLPLFRRSGLRPLASVEEGGGDLKGTVVDLFESRLARFVPDRILTCGPEPMMEAVLRVAGRLNVPVHASLEARMGCGMGVCLSCVTPFAPGDRPGGYALVCQDGPVFTVPNRASAVGSPRSP